MELEVLLLITPRDGQCCLTFEEQRLLVRVLGREGTRHRAFEDRLSARVLGREISDPEAIAVASLSVGGSRD